MKFIDITNLNQVAANLNWDSIKQAHMNNIAGMTVAQRKAYISGHPDWNLLQAAMLNLSNNKCWFSESSIGNNDLEIDHFRPKNRAKNHDGTFTKRNGYWWKAYDWDNYRLVGGLSNKRRSDRLNSKKEIKGKGDYFPLDLTPVSGGTIAADNASLACEVPLLLDPTKLYDVTLLSFDENGEPIAATDDAFEIDRVKLSIFYYHLDLEQLIKERKIAWEDCVIEIMDAKKAIDESVNRVAKTAMMEKCFLKLHSFATNKNRSYTSVCKACIMMYSELGGYKWLKQLIGKI